MYKEEQQGEAIPGQVSEQIERLGNLLEGLEKAIADLEGRLRSAVTEPNPVDDEAKTSKEPRQLVPLAQKMLEKCYYVQSAINKINDLHGRIEL